MDTGAQFPDCQHPLNFGNLAFEELGVDLTNHTFQSPDWLAWSNWSGQRTVNAQQQDTEPIATLMVGEAAIEGNASFWLTGIDLDTFRETYGDIGYRDLPLDEWGGAIADLLQFARWPEDARTLVFEFEGDVPEVMVGPSTAPPLKLTEIRSGVLSADISHFAGAAETLRFRAGPGVSTIVDDIQFVVPEPSAPALLLCIAWIAFRRRRGPR